MSDTKISIKLAILLFALDGKIFTLNTLIFSFNLDIQLLNSILDELKSNGLIENRVTGTQEQGYIITLSGKKFVVDYLKKLLKESI